MPATIRRIDLKDIDDRLLRLDEAAALLRVTPRTVRRLAATGVIRRVRIGRASRVRLSDVSRLIAAGTAHGVPFSEGEAAVPATPGGG